MAPLFYFSVIYLDKRGMNCKPWFFSSTMSGTGARRMQTRPSNLDKHPGDQVLKKRRRTKEEVQLEKMEKTMEKLRKQQEKEENIKRIADLENSMAKDDATTKNANIPPPHPRAIRRTYAKLDVTDESESEKSAMEPDLPAAVTEVPVAVPAPVETNEEVTPRKKKKQKVTAREQIDAARKAAQTMGGGEEVRDKSFLCTR